MSEKRISSQVNNQDVFVWALHLLGGANKEVDVEDVYLKCFELAPARLGWRTRPDIPDYKKISKALQSVEAKSHVGLVQKLDQYHRRLTSDGVRWIEEHETELRERYSGREAVPASASTNMHEKLRRRVKEHKVWDTDLTNIVLIADALECSPVSPKNVWQSRLISVERAGQVLQDDSLTQFSERLGFSLKEIGVI